MDNRVDSDKRNFLKGALAAGAVGIAASSIPAFGSTTIQDGSLISNANYIIFKEGSIIKAKNGITGSVDFTGSDAATIIQNAINAISGAGTIFIKKAKAADQSTYTPPGRFNIKIDYDIRQTITVPSGISIISDGAMIGLINFTPTTDTYNGSNGVDPNAQRWMAFLLNPSGENYDLSTSHMQFEGLSFVGPWLSTNNTNSPIEAVHVLNWSRGIKLQNIKCHHVAYPFKIEGPVYRSSINNCFIEQGETGVHIYTGRGKYPITLDNFGPANAFWIFSNDISSFKTAIKVDNATSGLTVTNNYMEGNGIGVDGVETIIGNFFSLSGTGIGIKMRRNTIVSGNTFITNSKDNKGVHNDESDLLNLTLVGNKFDLNFGASGIFADTGKRISGSATGNYFYMGTDGTGTTSVGINGAIEQMSITGNSFQGGKPAVKAGYMCVVEGNRFLSHYTGIEINGYNCIIKNNIFKDGIGSTSADIKQTVGGTSVSLSSIEGNVFTNTISTIVILSGSRPIIKNNRGYITESSGTGATFGSAISHGLSYTPTQSEIRIIPSANISPASRFWISNISPTTFTISTDQSTSALFAWSIESVK